MITDALLEIVFGIVAGIALLFPTYSPPPGPGLTMFAAANIVLPLSTIATLFGWSLAAMIASGTIWLVMKVVNVVRGSGA